MYANDSLSVYLFFSVEQQICKWTYFMPQPKKLSFVSSWMCVWHWWNDSSGPRICCVVIVVLISNTIICWAEDSVHSQVVWKLLRKGINNNNVNEHSCYTVLTIDQAVQITIQYLYIFSNKWTNCLLCGVKLHSE